MFNFNEKYMNETLNAMLAPGEKSLCPIYCVFKPPGFAVSKGTIMGYVSLTNAGRMLIAQNLLGRISTGSGMLSSIKKLKISKNVFGQTVVDVVFPDGKGSLHLKFQAASKVIGCDFPHQEENLKKMLYVLESVQERCGSN